MESSESQPEIEGSGGEEHGNLKAIAPVSTMKRVSTMQRIKEEETMLEEFEADDRVFLEKRFATFLIIVTVIVAICATLIFVSQRYMQVLPSGAADIEMCLQNARTLLANACSNYTVVCKNSELAIDIED